MVVRSNYGLRAIQIIIDDDGFVVPSRTAAEVLESAKRLLSWSKQEENNETCLLFRSGMLIPSCFTRTRSKHSTSIENMWMEYHKLRISDPLEWYVSHRLMKEIIKQTNKYLKHQIGEALAVHVL